VNAVLASEFSSGPSRIQFFEDRDDLRFRVAPQKWRKIIKIALRRSTQRYSEVYFERVRFPSLRVDIAIVLGMKYTILTAFHIFRNLPQAKGLIYIYLQISSDRCFHIDAARDRAHSLLM
jgi:hypothetical protein